MNMIESPSPPPPLPSLPDHCAALIQTSLKSHNPSAAKSIHALVVKSGLHLVSVYLTNNLINLYSKIGSFSDARRVFSEMPLTNIFTWNSILSMYANSGRPEAAKKIFDEMPERDSVSWTAMIAGFNKMGLFERALLTFLDMIKSRTVPTQFTFTNVLSSCAAIEALGVGKRVHSFVVKLGSGGCVPVANSLVNMYGKSGDPETAMVVFSRMRLRSTSSWNSLISIHTQSGRMDLAAAQFDAMAERTVVSWNAIVAGYNRNGMNLEALRFFARMLRESSVAPDSFTLTSTLSACADLGASRPGKEIHAHIMRTGARCEGEVANALISVYSKAGAVETARRVLGQTPVSGLNVVSFTALLEGYVKLGDMRQARDTFDRMEFHDVVAWTALIVGYAQNGFNDAAMDLFASMINDGPPPNSHTFAAVLSVCSTVASLDHGKQIHSKVVRSAKGLSVSVGNALITMYSKCGSITGARRVFEDIRWSKEPVSWTSMIVALAQHGFGAEAIELFDDMLRNGVKPDHITYVGVLTACTHAGLVEEGKEHFELMQKEHMIEPTPSHYACMIDLFARAGLLDVAQEFIKTMPIEPDSIAWGSLLAACRVHKNADLAKFASERLSYMNLFFSIPHDQRPIQSYHVRKQYKIGGKHCKRGKKMDKRSKP